MCKGKAALAGGLQEKEGKLTTIFTLANNKKKLNELRYYRLLTTGFH